VQDFEPGVQIALDDLRSRFEHLDRAPTPDEVHALNARALVGVSGEVAQIAKLGGREVDRRRKRNRAARASRKRNR
jgi:hypothetical protein